VLLGKVGQPDVIGSVAAFMASQESSYMTAQILYVDGGRMALNYTVPVPQQQEGTAVHQRCACCVVNG
jgi:enoyl-[acyl-carrier-protein] reductase (NADH)